MAQPVIQTSFNAGEWAPALGARVDLTKYHSGAALLRNFFVDYRGGATTRPGTKYILRCFDAVNTVRLIPFQASFTVSYILEFGNGYIRFFNNGAAVLEATKAITNITNANPGVLTSAAHGYNNGDWVFVAAVGGMTQVNNSYYLVTAKTANTFQLNDLNNNPVDTTTFGVYTAGGTVARVYTLSSPYVSADLSQIKFAQNVNTLILCQPNYVPYVLTLITANNWTIAPIAFGPTISAPTGQAVATTLGAGAVNYAYVITAVDINGQESAPSAFATLAAKLDLRTTAGTNTISWNAVTGADSYNVYKAAPNYAGIPPAGSVFGFIGNARGLSLADSNISQDFSQGPSIPQNPFSGSGVATTIVTAPGTYNGVAVPSVTFAASPGVTATGYAQVAAISVAVAGGGQRYAVGDLITLSGGGQPIIQVTSITSVPLPGTINGINLISKGSGVITGQITPTNPVGINSTNSVSGIGATFTVTWGVIAVPITSAGSGYGGAPAITFSSGAATATSALGAPSAGNPTVPGFFQQRLVLAGPLGNPQQFNMSQPGAYYNYNVSFPVTSEDAITGSLVSGRLNIIKSLISMPSGLVFLSDQQAWLVNGGSAGSAVTASSIVANAQAYNGASDLPPIIANYDILYVQSKSSIVRDLSYNFYTNVYAGANISTLSSHLFFGYTLLEWCWAEEPFKLVWAVRNDGSLLSLTFQKDQEMIAWTHHDTAGGSFNSIATVTEILSTGPTDAVYVVTQRSIQGTQARFIERMTELIYPQGYKSSWYLDAGITYGGAPATSFSGASHLAGLTVTGVADGVVISPFVMPSTGRFTLATPASIVTIGIAITGQIQTLALDLGEPTAQGKRKKITGVTLRCQNTLGLTIGRTFDSTSQKVMKDLVIGAIGTMTTGISSVTDLVTGDARTIIDPLWDVPGQYCIQQTTPFPATVLGVIPEIVIGDTK